MKQNTEIDLPDTVDAFDAVDRLRTVKGVLSAHAVTGSRITVKYDDRRLTPEAIKELIKENPKKAA